MSGEVRDHFHDVLTSLTATGLDFIVCGGMAAILHGVERTTLDIDLSVSLAPANVPKLVAAMEKLGLQSRVPVNPLVLADPDEVRKIIEQKHAVVFTFIHPRDPFLHVDIFLVPDLQYEKLIPHAVEKEFSGGTLKVLSAEHLLKLKKAIRPPRKKDEWDIEALEEILRQRREKS